MNVILCLDDKNGMTFNNRRQSKDRRVRKKILDICKGARLYMNEYSFGQFEEKAENIIVSESFLEKADNEDFCFVENLVFPLEKTDCLYIFRWNRVYPSDFKTDFDIINNNFSLVKSEEFEGFSHKKITLEIYRR